MKHYGLTLAALALVVCSAARGVTLEEALARALENNPQVQQAQAAVEQAAGQRLVFRSVTFPTVGLAIIAGAQGGHRAGQGPIEPFAFAQGSLRQPLFRAEIPASLRRGEIEPLRAAQQLNVVVAEQLHEVRVAFYTALYERSLETLGRSQRRRLDANIASEEARYEAGTVDRGTLAAATLQARELDPQIEEAHRAYGAALLQLATAMGASLGPGAALPSPEGTLDFIPVDLSVESETAAALEQRPDLRLARLLVRAARQETRIAEAGYYPRLDLTLFGRYIPVTNIRQASSGSAQRSDDIVSSEVAAGAGYTWRVIDNGKVSGAVLRQRSLGEINQLQLKKLEASVGRELKALQNNLRAITARHTSLVKAVGVAENNVDVVEKSWQEGLSSQLEFRTAETGLLVTRRGILSAAFEEQIALAAWDRATGRYFQFSDAPGANVHISQP